MSAHSVYALCDPRTGNIRYVGQTVNIHRRYAQHLLYSSEKKKKAWLEELREAGMLPTLIVLESDISDQDIDRHEMYWIKHTLSQGFALTNGTRHELSSVKPRSIVPKPTTTTRVMADETYAIIDLLDHLPCKIGELAIMADVNTQMIRRIKAGELVRSYVVNKLLRGLSQAYKRNLDRSNVTGIAEQRQQSAG